MTLTGRFFREAGTRPLLGRNFWDSRADPGRAPWESAKLGAVGIGKCRVRGRHGHGGSARSAVGESLEMAQRTIGRILAGVALTAALTLAGAAPAQAAVRGPSISALNWLQSFLGGRIAALWMAASGGGHRPSARPEKQGPAVDPNGGTGTGQTAGIFLPEKAGPAMDPNGGTGSSQPNGNSITTGQSLCIGPDC